MLGYLLLGEMTCSVCYRYDSFTYLNKKEFNNLSECVLCACLMAVNAHKTHTHIYTLKLWTNRTFLIYICFLSVQGLYITLFISSTLQTQLIVFVCLYHMFRLFKDWKQKHNACLHFPCISNYSQVLHHFSSFWFNLI